MGRRSAGRFADPEADPRAKAPAARRPWIFTWFGLALGIVLCLIMVANRFRDVPEPPPPELSQLDKEQSESLRKAFRRTLDDDERIASSELEKLPTLRLSLKDRAETMSGVLDQYAHTAVAPKIADAISKLQASVEEQANSVEGGAPETPSPGEGAGSAEPPPAPGEPPAPAAEGKKEESPDDIGAKAGGDDGKGDL